MVDTRIQEHVEKGDDFGFESTYSGESRPAIIGEAAKRGYTINAVFIGTTSPDINIQRVKKRVAARTGHAVPTKEIIRRWTAAQENLAKTAGSIDSIEVLDNSKTIRQVSVLVRDRTTSYRKPAPSWATELTKRILANDPTLSGPEARGGQDRADEARREN